VSARKRPSAGDYLASLQELEPVRPPKSAPTKASKSASEASAPTKRQRQKLTLYFREALLEEARAAVLAIGAKGQEPSNLSRLFEGALEHELERLRRVHDAGASFGLYPKRLPGGRPRSRA
jgi:hypothetical protein